MEGEIQKIEKRILGFDKKTDNILIVAQDLHKIQRKLITLQLSKPDEINKSWLKSTKLLDKYIKLIQLDEQNQNIRLLTMISTICLPLGIIVGAFGMNFAFMGIDPDTKGIFRWKSAPIVFWSLFIGNIVILIVLFNIRLL